MNKQIIKCITHVLICGFLLLFFLSINDFVVYATNAEVLESTTIELTTETKTGEDKAPSVGCTFTDVNGNDCARLENTLAALIEVGQIKEFPLNDFSDETEGLAKAMKLLDIDLDGNPDILVLAMDIMGYKTANISVVNTRNIVGEIAITLNETAISKVKTPYNKEVKFVFPAAHTHNYSTKWTADGANGHYHNCLNPTCPYDIDGERNNMSGYETHSFGGWIVDVEATEFTVGKRHCICDTCGYVYEQDYLYIKEDSIDTYDIVFDANGGNFGKDTTDKYILRKEFEIHQGNTISLSNYRPVREGYSFLGWKKSTSAEEQYYIDGTSTPDSDTTYVAGWKKIYTITYNANGGYFGKRIDGEITEVVNEYEDGANILYEAIPQRDGYKFIGYKDKNTGILYSTNSYYTIKSDSIFIAQWGKIVNATYINGKETIKVKTYVGCELPIGRGMQIINGNQVIYPTYIYPQIDSGVIFIGWKTDKDNNIYVYDDKYTINDDITFVAQFKKMCKVTYDPNEQCGSFKNYYSVFSTPQSISPKNVIHEGYNKTGNKTGDNLKKQFSFYVSEGTKLKVGQCNDNKELVSVVSEKYNFKGWKNSIDNRTYSPNTDIIIDKDITFTAIWEEKPLVSFEATVEKNSSTALLVSGLNTNDTNHRGKFSLKISSNTVIEKNGKKIAVSKITKGTRIRVYYCGEVQETYPAQISDVRRIEITKEVTTPVPLKPTLSPLKNTKGKKMVIKWKKVKNAKGYQVEWALDSKFKKSKKSKTLSQLTFTAKNLKKSKTYYVRVRAYTKDSKGKKVYGKWSTVKKITIKK